MSRVSALKVLPEGVEMKKGVFISQVRLPQQTVDVYDYNRRRERVPP